MKNTKAEPSTVPAKGMRSPSKVPFIGAKVRKDFEKREKCATFVA
jgi:hypothetical protein